MNKHLYVSKLRPYTGHILYNVHTNCKKVMHGNLKRCVLQENTNKLY